MKVSGFTIVRNAVKYDYPAVEAINSILPVCDEMVVAVGKSEDETLKLIRSINSPKIRIIETVWDDGLREGGKLLAVETDKALAAISPDSDWAFYIQADEVLHEQYFPVVRSAMEQCEGNREVEALQFRYKHFYGSYDYIQDNNRKWYTKECRVIKRDPNIVSWGDGMDFRHRDGSKLLSHRIQAEIYHYGWVRPPQTMVTKQEAFRKLYFPDVELKDKLPENMYTDLGNLRRFTGSHPAVMLERIALHNWEFDARLDEQHPDWFRHTLLFLQPLTKRIRRVWGSIRTSLTQVKPG